MRAFVLSGGGNLGPAQVGALRALLEQDIRPEMLVGCSVGALNATFLAREVTLQQLDRLAEIWRRVDGNDIYPGGRMRSIIRFLSGKDSLFDNRNLYAFLQRHGVTPAELFADYSLPRLYITATHLSSGRLHVFGDQTSDSVLDALMASTALTPLHPPWEVNGEHYVDGGTVTPLPLRVALERGATEIVALHLMGTLDENGSQGLVRGVVAVMARNIGTMLRLQAQHDLLLTEVAGKVKLHYIPLTVAHPPKTADFSQADRLLTTGYDSVQAYLHSARSSLNPARDPVPSPWARARSLLRLSRPKVGAQAPTSGQPTG